MKDENKKEKAVIHNHPVVHVHVYCFDCKADNNQDVQAEKADICPTCGSTRVAHDPKENEL